LIDNNATTEEKPAEENNLYWGSEPDRLPISVKWLLGIGSTLLSLITIGGNILVIIAFCLERKLRSQTNFFLLSLAVTDLLIGLFSVNLFTSYLLLGEWKLGKLVCDLWLSLDYTACLTSQYTVFCITLDRYLSVKMPAAYRNWRTDSKVIGMIATTWIIPAGIFFTVNLGWDTLTNQTTNKGRHCEPQFNKNKEFNMGLTIFYFWTTLFLMSCLYAGIYKVAVELQRKSDAKRQKVTSLFSMAGQTMSRIGVALPGQAPSSTQLLETCLTAGPQSPIKAQLEQDGNSTVSSLAALDPQSVTGLDLRCSSPTFNCYQHSNSSITSPFLADENGSPQVYPSSSKCDSFRLVDIWAKEDQFVCSNQLPPGNSSPTAKPTTNALILGDAPIWKPRGPKNNGTVAPVVVAKFDPREALKLKISQQNGFPTKCQMASHPKATMLQQITDRFRRHSSKKERSERARNQNRARKAFRTISIIMGAFVICWTPFHIMVLTPWVSGHLYNLTYWLCYINSPINPFCYALANVQFKQTFIRILKLDFRRL
ncbi:Serpentine type 7TM GPCR chemoreceptor Srsx, partial [Cichlidogyrus casuarinus]